MDNIETKILRPSAYFEEGGEYDEIEDLKAFGWQVQSQQGYTYRSGRCHHSGMEYVLVRDLSLPHLEEKRKLEASYQEAKESLSIPPEGPDGVIALFLLVLFIIPGVIYLAVTNNRHSNGVLHNQYVIKTMKYYVSKAAAL
jgi:hypothetical protein